MFILLVGKSSSVCALFISDSLFPNYPVICRVLYKIGIVYNFPSSPRIFTSCGDPIADLLFWDVIKRIFLEVSLRQLVNSSQLLKIPLTTSLQKGVVYIFFITTLFYICTYNRDFCLAPYFF